MTIHKPTRYPVITCAYGVKGHAWAAGHHTGTDFQGQFGDPVFAVAGGEIIHSGRMHGWGLAYGVHVIIESEGVVQGKLQTLYAHLAHVNLDVVGKGKVKAGDIIGYIGASGNAPTGPHLHLEMRVSPFLYDNKTIDPESVLKLAKPALPIKKVGPKKK